MNNSFPISEPNFPSTSTAKRKALRIVDEASAVINPAPPIPSVWTQIRDEQRSISLAPSERALEQKKADISNRIKSVIEPQNIKTFNSDDDDEVPNIGDEEYTDLLELRSKIETLLDEHQSRSLENESNLVELRLVLENLNYHFSEDPEETKIEDATKYMSQVQHGQERLQESISYLVKGAAQLFMQKNHLKIEKLRQDIQDITYNISQIDEQIRIKNQLLEERLNSSSKIDAANMVLRRRIETTKAEIRSIAGQDFEEIPELARTYQDTMKKIIAEEVDLTRQLWDAQQQLEKEKKDQVQLSILYQKVKDYPVRLAQLQQDMEAKIAALRNELFKKEKAASQQRGEVAAAYQSETQRLVIQARKDREELLFSLKINQIEQLLQAERTSREEKMSAIMAANTALASNKAFKDKVSAMDRESRQLVESYEQQVNKIKIEFSQTEKRLKREHEQKMAEAEQKARQERKGLEDEVASMEMQLAAKDEQYKLSMRKLESLQTQLASLKEKIAKLDVSNRQLEKAIDGTSVEAEELMTLLNDNKKRKLTEKNIIKRRLMDAINSVAYFMVLNGKADGDWLEEAKETYAEAIKLCEGENEIKRIPIPFNRKRPPPEELFKAKTKKTRRSSF